MAKNNAIFNPLDQLEKDLQSELNKKNVQLKRPKNHKKYVNQAVSASNNTLSKSKAISIRLSERDLNKVKAKALENGLPYQTLIGSLIGKYAKGEIKLEL